MEYEIIKSLEGFVLRVAEKAENPQETAILPQIVRLLIEIEGKDYPEEYSHFGEYFICPNCGEPRFPKKSVPFRIKRGSKFCGGCGESIADALEEALAIIIKEQATDSLPC